MRARLRYEQLTPTCVPPDCVLGSLNATAHHISGCEIIPGTVYKNVNRAAVDIEAPDLAALDAWTAVATQWLCRTTSCQWGELFTKKMRSITRRCIGTKNIAPPSRQYMLDVLCTQNTSMVHCYSRLAYFAKFDPGMDTATCDQLCRELEYELTSAPVVQFVKDITATYYRRITAIQIVWFDILVPD